jgi:DNA-directed RNA polymerase subunit beta'
MVQSTADGFATSYLKLFVRRVTTEKQIKKAFGSRRADISSQRKKGASGSVDALIDNGRLGRTVTVSNNRALKSLSDMLKGSRGVPPESSGKRVDYRPLRYRGRPGA